MSLTCVWGISCPRRLCSAPCQDIAAIGLPDGATLGTCTDGMQHNEVCTLGCSGNVGTQDTGDPSVINVRCWGGQFAFADRAPYDGVSLYYDDMWSSDDLVCDACAGNIASSKACICGICAFLFYSSWQPYRGGGR